MTAFLFANNTRTTLAGPIAANATTINLAAGTGALYPQPISGQQFSVTLTSQANQSIREIVYCSTRSGDSLTVIRAQEGTTATAFLAGDFVDNYLTAGSASAFVQSTQLQQQMGNYAVDMGTVNNVVVTLSPAVVGVSPGTPVRVRIAYTNTGTSTINVGTGASTITTQDGQLLLAGALITGGIAELISVSGAWQLLNPAYAAVNGGFRHMLTVGSSTTWTAPPGVVLVKVRCWGAGGAGASSISAGTPGGGAGGGGYAEGLVGVTPGTTYNLTIGVGGASINGGSSATGATGGSSGFGSFISATGGAGGTAGTGTMPGNGGNPGVGAGGSFNLPGQGGGDSAVFSTILSFGGGGGSYGSSNALQSIALPGVAGVATPGIFPGGGGSGTNGGTSGAGAGGCIILEW
jgi:hypothetical protein